MLLAIMTKQSYDPLNAERPIIRELWWRETAMAKAEIDISLLSVNCPVFFLGIRVN